MGFRHLVSLLPAIQATGLVIFTLEGLAPSEHTSFPWTHNRTGESPAYGSPVSGFPIEIDRDAVRVGYRVERVFPEEVSFLSDSAHSQAKAARLKPCPTHLKLLNSKPGYTITRNPVVF
ncbi:MAG: hypothetical protein NG784_13640 [Candidatus Jettenia sp.]|nr:hypothetical protein [Candidatus Jettenia sp.]